ncbi:replication factor A protein 3 [Phellopilus nigrolimitatus]|nr:replication factor A protein 3 [Phellopilus nigrolimitatus]
MDHITPRVNSALLGKFIGRSVRLVCKVERVKGMSAIVRSTDMGQVEVKMTTEGQIEDTFVEVIGMVEDSNVLKLQACINLGGELDMELVNDCIELCHDERFKNIF